MLIHFDRPATWPAELLSFVSRVAASIERSGRRDSPYASDLGSLDLDDAIDSEFRSVLTGHRIVGFHATRLLPHEVDGIRTGGIHVLTDELRERKLHQAKQHYPDLLTDDGVALLMRSGPLTWQRGAQRLGMLWFVVPWLGVLDEAGGLSYLLATWGGEAIGWVPEDATQASGLIATLTALSVPALVEFAVDLATTAQYGSLWTIPVGLWLGLQHPWGGSHTNADMFPEHVVRVWTANDEDWPEELDIVRYR